MKKLRHTLAMLLVSAMLLGMAPAYALELESAVSDLPEETVEMTADPAPAEESPAEQQATVDGVTVTADEIVAVKKDTVVDLTAEGTAYWKYFLDKNGTGENDRAWVQPLAEVAAENGYLRTATDKIVAFRYSDGLDPQDNDESYATESRGWIYQGVDTGVTLTVPGSTKARTLKLYFGDYDSTFKVEVFLNGGETPLVTKEYIGYTATSMPMFSMDYQTRESDTLTVKATISEMGDTGYGSFSLHALTVSGEPAPAPIQAATTKYSEDAATTKRDVNLTEEGNLDWLYIDGATGTSAYDQKKQDTHAISGVVLANSDQDTNNAALNVSYTDGTNQAAVNGGHHMGIYNGASKEALSFDVPGSTTGRTIRIYSGSWNSQIVLTVKVNGEAAYTETFGKDSSADGGWSYVSEIHYQTTSDADTVSVSLATTAGTQGNMNLTAVTLHDANYVPPEPDEPDDAVYLRDITRMTYGSTVDLTADGTGYWTYFSGRQVEKKDAEPLAYLSDSVGSAGRATNDKHVHFKYTDGAGPEDNTGSYQTESRGSIYVGEGSGFTFTLLPSTEERSLNLYMGCYQATYTVEVYQNGALVGSKTHTETASQFSKVSLRYQTAEKDELTVKVTIDAVTDAKDGSFSLQALTIDGAKITPDYTGQELSNDRVSVLHPGGNIKSLVFADGQGDEVNVPFATAMGNAGPSWQVNGTPLRLTKTEDPQVYTLTTGGVEYKLTYSIAEDGVVNVAATMTNKGTEDFAPERASLSMGIDTYMMDRWADYENLFFPTLLRCEKNYLWGYFQSPNGHVVSVAVDAPVSSYRLNYESGGHRIWTATLDLMQKDGTLPERHPQNNSTLAAGESRTWNLKLKLSDGVGSVKADVEAMIGAPMVEADRYTVGAGESAQIKVYSDAALSAITVDKMVNANAPSLRTGKDEVDVLTTTYTPCDPLPLTSNGDGTYSASFTPADGEGVYRLRVVGGHGFQSEAMITLRNSWSWYMENAMEKAITHPARGGSHAESYYNAYSFYLGQKYFDLPDTDLARATDDNYFRDVYDVMGYNTDWTPEVYASRIQNTSTIIGQMVDRYEALGEIKSLEDACHIADFIIDKHQRGDGAYVNGNTDYTSVIYPAKSIMELMHAEQKLIDAGGDDAALWQTRWQKQYDSVKRSMDRLVAQKGELQTEGQGTFEDGAFSCSSTQLSEFALMHAPGSAERAKYQASAEDYMRKHDALEQMLIPDSRMNGGSLRFWEAQYDTLVHGSPDNMMNSPHGWSAWNIYGLFNLYELTGDQKYLERGMNAMGSCAQLMGFDGNLYWAFISDPYVPANQFVQVKDDQSQYGTGEYRNVTIGESYVDMITDWFRSPPSTEVFGYSGQGGSCDNDVHEVFKALEECVLTKAFVVEGADGSYTAYNCSAEEKDGVLTITADTDELTDRVSLNLKSARKYSITFSNGETAAGNARVGLSEVVFGVQAEQGKAITTFTIDDQVGETVIDEVNHTVTVALPLGTDVTALTPAITASTKAVVTPASGVPQNFTAPVTYTVTAEDGTTQDYTVTVSVQTDPIFLRKIAVVPYGTTVDLTAEGTRYWTYYTTTTVEKKDVPPLAERTDSVGEKGALTQDKNIHFKYTDGTGPENNLDTYTTELRGTVYEKVGSGFTFTVPGSTELRDLDLYLGCYSATYEIEVFLNGMSIGKQEHTETATQFDKFSMRCQTAATDVLEIKVTITSVSDPTYGSISLQALTIDGVPVAEEPEEPSYNPPSNTTTKTEKNGDGSTTKTVSNKKTGSVTETTTYPDGTKIVATTPKDGETSIEVTVPKGKNSVTVTIPTAEKPTPGQVAAIVHEDGAKEIVKTSVATEDGLRVTLTGSAKLEILDNSKPFSDVADDHWAAGAVTFVTSRELFTGTGADTFSPAAGMTRGMLMTVLARLDGQDTTLGDTWYSAGMDWAKEQGVSDGTAPEAEITRESLVVMLYRYAGNPEVDESRRVKDAAPYGEFADVDSVSDWAGDAMLWAVQSGILQGSGDNLNPGGTATRAEVAAMLQRFLSQ